MAYLNPKEAFADLKQNVIEGLQAHFPITGSKQSIHLEGVDVREHARDFNDLTEQHKAKVEGRSWTVPVFGALALKNNQTGEVLDRKSIQLADLPYMTQRHAYIVDGREYQVDNQWRLKPGVYTRRKEDGELKSQFNVQGKRPFDITLDPETKVFSMIRGDSKNIPVYPLMKELGVDDDTLQASWGKEVLAANRGARAAGTALERFYKADKKRAPTSTEEARQHFIDTMEGSKIRPEVTQITLGKPYDHVNGNLLHDVTTKMIGVQRGEIPEDERDSLVFKDLHTVADFAKKGLTDWKTKKALQARTARKINTATSIRQVIHGNMFSRPVKATFTENALARTADQVNPVEMLTSSFQTTIMGPGGIQSDNAISESAKLINPSQIGFLDSIHTPEGSKTGVTLHLPMGVIKRGNTPLIPVYNLRTQQMDHIDPVTYHKSVVMMPDQVTWNKSTPIPVGKRVMVSQKGNELVEADASSADYVMRSPSQLFSMTSNLIPFLGNNSGNRASYATHHIEQAISLHDRDAPLVQSGTGRATGVRTFEEFMGRQSAHIAPTAGTVTKVTADAITVQDKEGKDHHVTIYNNFPLNDPKAVLHSTPAVKEGDAVTPGQLLADNNFTRNGQLALGKNLLVAYIPFKGHNFEDGIAISQTAAAKMASEHMHKPSITLGPDAITGLAKYKALHPTSFETQQLEHLDDAGVVRVGQTVRTGDPLVVASRPFDSKGSYSLSKIRKSLSSQTLDSSLTWKSEHPGEVVGIHRDEEGNVTVHVRTVEPMQVGDKMCYDEETEMLTARGWLPVADVTCADEVCSRVDGHIVYQSPDAVFAYPTGGRMYRIKSRQVDLLVTDKHDMFVKERGASDFLLTPAATLFGRRIRYAKSGLWQGHDPEYIAFPALCVRAGQYGNGSRMLPEVRLPVSVYCMLLGAYVSNGHTFDQPGDYGIAIDKATGPQFEELCRALTEANIAFSRTNGATCSRVTIHSKQWLEHFRVLGRARVKYIPEHIFSFSRDSLCILFKWLMWGNGSSMMTGRPVAYFTSSKRLADDVQRLALHVGYAGNVRIHAEEGWQTIKGKPSWCARSYEVRIVTTKLEPQVNNGHVKKQRAQEEYFVENYTKPVYCVRVPGHVVYVRRNGKAVWSGNSGRHGNKGVITTILPDKEMPHTADGRPIEVVLNPSGVPGRMNMGQVLETAAGKIAEKTGQTYIVNNFEHGVDQLDRVKKALKEHGLTDTEEVIDPVSGQSLGKALVGPQHLLKLNFQIDKKVSVRSGMPLEGAEPEHYDADTLIPAQGGKTGGQSMGNLGLYGMLAHGAKHNIREMQTWKSEGADRKERWDSLHNEVWRAIQTGETPPPPKKTFAFQKFEDMLTAAGINVTKRGHTLQLTPLTNQQILAQSAGALPNPGYSVISKKGKAGDEPVARKGGVFDPAITGGHGGQNWSHIVLPEPVPNPVFEHAIQRVLGLKEGQYADIVNGEAAVKDGKVVPLGTEGSKAGGAAIAHMLGELDVKEELKKAKDALDKLKVPANLAHRDVTPKLDQLSKQVRYLSTLDKAGIHPKDAYVLENLPVIPPIMRPASFLPNGNVHEADLNSLYTRAGQLASAMQSPNYKYLSDHDKKEDRFNLYDSVKALMGVGEDWATRGKQGKGVLLQIAGSAPKEGYFQNTLLSRRQDMTMRATITPDASMGLDQVGLPEKKALDLFRPFVVNKLQEIGAASTPREAHALLSEPGKKDPAVYQALDKVMAERPVLLKRDPVLHKHGVQAFWPQRVPGKAIQIHPLTTGGFTADFDGDTMALYVPIGRDAVEEAKGMVPSRNVYNEASGKVIYQPSLEASLGLFKLSRVTGDSGKTFDSHAALLKAAQAGKLTVTETATVDGKPTTAGRILLASAVPESMQHDMLHNMNLSLNKKGTDRVYTQIAKEHKAAFADSAVKLMRLGYDAAFGVLKIPNPATQGTAAAVEKDGEHPKDNVQYLPMGTHSLSLNDFTPDKATRDTIVAAATKKVEQINARTDLSDAEREQHVVNTWHDATDQMLKEHDTKMTANPNNLYLMQQAGVKPGPIQYRQLRLAPMLMVDSQNRVISTPVTKSYSEGLDVSSYWTQMAGARRGSVLKVQEVREPGYFTKKLINVTMGLQVTKHDCGTDNGLHLPIHSQDIFDRTLAQEHTIGGVTYAKDTVITPQVASTIKAADKNATLLVRSTLKCDNGTGVCQKCAGLAPDGQHYSLGTNVGILATQALGERATQLTLKAFHGGGVAERGANLVNDFIRVQQLTSLPKEIPNAARLAAKDGVVEKIEEDPTGHVAWIGGVKHHIANDDQGNPLFKPLPGQTESTLPGGTKWTGLQVGMKVRAGDPLTDPARTYVNPHDLYAVTGSMAQVQNHLVTELHDIYGREGVRRQNTETVVRALSDLTRVINPGDHETMIKGQYASRAKVQEANRQLIAQGLQPIQHTPIMKGISVMPLEVQEDWMAKLNHERLRDPAQGLPASAALGASSDLHGNNPVAGMAYGAEFGMTNVNVFDKPHLKDVASHAY